MSKKTLISIEDKTLFRNMMRDVTPLNHTPKPMNTAKSNPVACESFSKTDYELSDYYPDPIHSESLLTYHRHGLTQRQINALRSHQIIYEAKLDLHGLQANDAKDQLSQFIAQQMQSNRRIVLIIHGKGGKYGEPPVLKNLVNHWLPQIPDVLAFHSARPQHGGTGAMYVLLRRVRTP